MTAPVHGTKRPAPGTGDPDGRTRDTGGLNAKRKRKTGTAVRNCLRERGSAADMQNGEQNSIHSRTGNRRKPVFFDIFCPEEAMEIPQEDDEMLRAVCAH